MPLNPPTMGFRVYSIAFGPGQAEPVPIPAGATFFPPKLYADGTGYSFGAFYSTSISLPELLHELFLRTEGGEIPWPDNSKLVGQLTTLDGTEYVIVASPVALE